MAKISPSNLIVAKWDNFQDIQQIQLTFCQLLYLTIIVARATRYSCRDFSFQDIRSLCTKVLTRKNLYLFTTQSVVEIDVASKLSYRTSISLENLIRLAQKY